MINVDFKLNYNNIDYVVNIRVHDDIVFTDWTPNFNKSIFHDLPVIKQKVPWDKLPHKYPKEFKDYINNLVDKFFKLTVFL